MESERHLPSEIAVDAVSAEAAEPDPLTVDAAGAARLLGISLSHLFALKKSGRFGPAPIRLGRAVRYRRQELIDWVAAGCPSRARWQGTARK